MQRVKDCGRRERLVLWWLRRVHNRTDRTFAPTAQLCAELETLGFRNLALLSRGVDTWQFHPARRSGDLRLSWNAATENPVVIHAGRRIGITICEDIWTNPALGTRRLYTGRTPLEHLVAERCDLVVNLSASPWHESKADVRNSLVVTGAARALGCPPARTPGRAGCRPGP